MFPAKYKLNPTEIPFVARRGKRIERENFYIKAWYDDSLDAPKFAVIASKKVSNKATERNRIRRVVREQLIAEIKEGKFKPGKYLAVCVKV